MKKTLIIIAIVAGLATIAYFNFKKVNDVQDGTAYYQRAMHAATQIAEDTKNPTAQNIVKFLSQKTKVCEPNVDSLLALRYDVKDTLYVCPLMQEDNIYIGRTKHPEIFSTLSTTDVVYVENILILNGRGRKDEVSERYLGLLLLYGAYLHGGGDDIAAIEFQSQLLQALGGADYSRLFDLEYLRLQKQYMASGKIAKPDTSVTANVERQMCSIFGKPKLQREGDHMANIFWISAAFKVYDNQPYMNPEVGKLAFLQDLSNGWD